jgi:hypothetical protein
VRVGSKELRPSFSTFTEGLGPLVATIIFYEEDLRAA